MKNNESAKGTPKEINLINNYMYEANNSIRPAISILELFIESFSFDMARPTEINLRHLENRWEDAGNILFTIQNQLRAASDKLEEIL